MIKKEELDHMGKISNIDNPLNNFLPFMYFPISKHSESFDEGLKYLHKEFERYEKKKLEKEKMLKALLQKRKENKLRKKTQALRHYRKKLIKLNKRKAS